MKKMIIAMSLFAALGAQAEKIDSSSLLSAPRGAKTFKAVTPAQRAFTESLTEGLGDRVYCDRYVSSTVNGYSLYRVSDRKDIGNAVWTADNAECSAAAQMANAIRANIACSKYHNKTNNTTAYSVYRISDGQDLGKATISSFETCQAAIHYSRRGIFCSTYNKDNVTWWSLYDVVTGHDLGTSLYSSLEKCQQNY